MTSENGIKHEPLRSDDGDYDDPDHDNSINHPIKISPTETQKFTIIEQDENEMENENGGTCHLPPKTNIPLLTAALLASGTTGGTTYAFGLYASALKATLHLSQEELDTISATFFCAGLFSWIPGLAVDSFGPRLSLGSGGILGAIALLSYWSVAVEILPIPRSAVVPVLSLLGVITFLSSSLVTGSVFKIVSGCCEQGRSKGAAVGAAKGYVGLGAGAYACLFRNVKGEGWSDLNFLVMAAVFAVLACTLPAVFLLDHETAAVIGKSASSGRSASRGQHGSRSNPGVLDVTTGLHFRIIYSGLLLLGAIVVGTSLLSLYSESKSDPNSDSDSESQSQSSNSYGNYLMAFIIANVWFGPILLMLKLPTSTNTPLPSNDDETWHGEDDGDEYDNQFELVHSNLSRKDSANNMTDEEDNDQDKIDQHNLIHQQTNQSQSQSQSQSNTQQQPSSQTQPSKSQTPKSSKSSNSIQTEYTTLQMLQTPQALLLFWTTTILAGGGTVMTNNMGQMAEALYFSPVVASASVAIFSAAQAAARVIAGSLSEIALRRWKLPRPTFFVFASVASVASHFLLAFARTEAMFVFAVAQSGVAFGAIWPLMVLLVGEIFGMENMASNYMFYDGGTSAVGTLVLSKFVAQWVYERHVVEEDGDGIDVGVGVGVDVDESDSEPMGHYYFETDDNIESQDAFAGGGGMVAGGEGGGAVGGDGLNCFGPECFELTHQIVAVLSVTCVVSSVVLMYITKDNYARKR